jgi:hypothetical protein
MGKQDVGFPINNNLVKLRPAILDQIIIKAVHW